MYTSFWTLTFHHSNLMIQVTAEATSERTGETPHVGQKHTTMTGTLTASGVHVPILY